MYKTINGVWYKVTVVKGVEVMTPIDSALVMKALLDKLGDEQDLANEDYKEMI